MKTAKLGSVSHATLRTEDLLSCFISELEGMMLINGDHFCLPKNFSSRDRLASLIGEAQDMFSDDGESIPSHKLEEAMDAVNTLMDALDEFAPPYCSFGAHDGDGSDFGFWPSWESINELPQVESSDEAKALGEDAMFSNDHGNVTIYGADGSVLLELV